MELDGGQHNATIFPICPCLLHLLPFSTYL